MPMNQSFPSIAAETAAPPAPVSWAWLLGTVLAQRSGVKRLLWSGIAYLAGAAFWALAAVTGLMPAQHAWLLCLYFVGGQLAFYALLRSGYAISHADPTLAYPQVLFGVTCVALTYCLADFARGAALQMLCVLMVFDMQRLDARRIRNVSACAVVLLAGALATMWGLQLEGLNLQQELINIVMAAVMLPMLFLIAREVGGIRERQVAQRAELSALVGQLHQISTHDALTGLYNRRCMGDLLQEELKRVRRNGQPFCVAILDIDWFKSINDQHGHAVGDAVLKAFATAARKAARGTDALARWGGEEFLLLLPGVDAAGGLQAMARLRDRMLMVDWSAHAGGLRVSFSAGVAEYEAGETIDALLERADQALYAAKEAGRDRAEAALPLPRKASA